ncbi:hypothetical protein EJV47_11010 [Hymenobacter gummosus]|uniref:Endonuclease GajA/Old nuclease/RecF-like AAA domain-containing protein n=1 Tax=Hymenobacter gummosus TaxID=1776032 RepID=A0A3S0H9S6_9BACT|nr:AAA family ATPase [Hymenobacter gummosus]RTQ50157.1 hypothetical protein EJV47_11010 [Hymenobacter gummosus]
MTERLIIRNFAGLEEVDIKLARINIFIGPQASGKSVCAKCLYWFKSFLPTMLNAAQSGDDKRQIDAAYISRFKEYFPGLWKTDKTLFLRYEFSDYLPAYNFIQLENINGKLKLTYSDLFRDAAKVYRQEVAAAHRAGYRSNAYMWESNRIVEINDMLRYEVGDAFNATQLFILAGRSFFSALKGATLSFLAQAPVVDPFLREFLTLYELSRRRFLNNDLVRHKDFSSLAAHILRGRIEIKGEEEFIVNDDGRRVSLAQASSGQQESFALLLILLNNGLEDIPHFSGEAHSLRTVYIEEPETHLFPESQRAMAQLMATVYHESVYTLQYVITTHSPYLLTSFNNLVYAHQLAETLRDQPAKLKALYKVVPKNQQLALADMRVYGFENGRVKSLIDEESGLLTADLLDSASDVTADQFGALMALDPATQPE